MAKKVKIGNQLYRIVFTNPHTQFYCRQYGRIENRPLLFGFIPWKRWYEYTNAEPYEDLIRQLEVLKKQNEEAKRPPEPLQFLDIPDSLNS